MAKLHGELTAHENSRKVSRSSNTRLKFDLFQGNKRIGTIKAYPITGEPHGHRIEFIDYNGESYIIQDTDSMKA